MEWAPGKRFVWQPMPSQSRDLWYTSEDLKGCFTAEGSIVSGASFDNIKAISCLCAFFFAVRP